MLLWSLFSRIRVAMSSFLVVVSLATNASAANSVSRIGIAQFNRPPSSEVNLSERSRSELQRLKELATQVGAPRRIETSPRLPLPQSLDLAALEAALRTAKAHIHRRAMETGAQLPLPGYATPMPLPSVSYPFPQPWTVDPLAARSMRSRSVNAPIRRMGNRAAKATPKREVASANAISAAVPFTGINRYWRYEEGNVPGAGHYFVNVGGHANFLFQATDMDVSNKGIDLAFRRTYNSLSQHDYNGTDGSQISNYGDGWTNTFDAHVAYNGTSNSVGPGISLYDVDGARYDFVASYTNSAGTTVYAPPPGRAGDVLATTASVIGWHKKSGTVYGFYPPNIASTTPADAGIAGRTSVIYGRNHGNYLVFAYTFDSQMSTPQNLNQIVVTTEAGQSATLAFSDVTVGSGTRRLLTSLTRPNGVYTTYEYNSSGELFAVSAPPNSTTTKTCADTPTLQPTTCLSSAYAYSATGYQLTTIAGPRHFVSGDYAYSAVSIAYQTNSNSVSQIAYAGIVNPSISDGYSSGAIQPSYGSANAYYRTIAFTPGTGTMTMADTDGHQTIYDFNAPTGIVSGVSEYVTSSDSLNFAFGYDSTNYDLTSETDARANETDYQYDSLGNVVAEAKPAQTGGLRPTSYYSYNAYNDIVSYCDPEYSSQHSITWTSTPAASDTLCPTTAGTASSPAATIMQWSTTSAEPTGELTQLVTPMGYHRTFSYATGPQGGTDYGLPTQVLGDAIQQFGSNGTLQENETFSYDAYGDLATYGTGSGTWQLTYDNENRLTQSTDPDGVSSYIGYYPNDSVEMSQSASQKSAGVSITETYDGDGNPTTETHYHSCTTTSGCPSGTIQKWYDGDDRLVEVYEPHDSRSSSFVPSGSYDVYNVPYLTRYFYDLTEGGTPSAFGNAITAHGGLFDTQQYLPNGSSYQWTDTAGSAFDALDRKTIGYRPHACTSTLTYGSTANAGPLTCTNAAIEAATSTYDASSATLGLMATKANATGQAATYAYDADGEVTQTSYSDETPTRSYSFDPDGRTTAIAIGSLGSQQYSFDNDGRQIGATEPSKINGAATLTYGYYADGSRSSVSVAPETGSNLALSQSNLLQYAYRADKALVAETLTYGATQYPVTWGYSAGGRETFQLDPSGSQYEQTRTYDTRNFGHLSSLALGSNEFSGLTYDLEDELASGVNGGTSYGVLDNVRGQNVATTDATSNCYDCALEAAPMANGMVVNPTGSQWDTRNGIIIGGNPPGQISPGLTTYSYDNALRQTLSSTYVSTTDSAKCTTSTQSTATTGYDAEDRTISEASSTKSSSSSFNMVTNACSTPQVTSLVQTASYTWGAKHPISWTDSCSAPSPDSPGQIGCYQSPYSISYHWDNDDLLFSTSASGAVNRISMGSVADLVINGALPAFDVYDRDLTGSAVAYHTAGFAGVASWSAGWNVKASSITYPRTDGVSIGAIDEPAPYVPVLGMLAQGGRAYNSISQSWTTPDSDPGDVQSPISQDSFAWVNENPYEYRDPSGNDTCAGGVLTQTAYDPHYDACSSADSKPKNDVADGFTVYFGIRNGLLYIGRTGQALVRRQAQHGFLLTGLFQTETKAESQGLAQICLEFCGGVDATDNVINEMGASNPNFVKNTLDGLSAGIKSSGGLTTFTNQLQLLRNLAGSLAGSAAQGAASVVEPLEESGL